MSTSFAWLNHTGVLTISSACAIRTMMSCAIHTMMSCGYPQFPGQLPPTRPTCRVKSNCRLYHLLHLLPFLFRKTITFKLPPQWGDASICWYSALRECWTEAKLLPAQEELTRDVAGSASVEQIPQGSVPVNPINSSSPPPTEPGDIPPSRNRPPGPPSPGPPDRGGFPMARTY